MSYNTRGAQNHTKATKKRLVCLCDGTWLNADNGTRVGVWPLDYANKKLIPPSNVTRTMRALKTTSSDGAHQIGYYQNGIGSQGGAADILVGGLVGAGLAENIRESYAFFANNYEREGGDKPDDKTDDELFIFGFSRGAFTARSICSFIDAVGLLTKKGLDDFYSIFMDWENQNTPGWKNPWPKKHGPKEGDKELRYRTDDVAGKKKYVDDLVKKGLTRYPVYVKAVGVYDTVGALGIPPIAGLKLGDTRQFAFVNAEIPSNLEYAYHALALDENRRPFAPTLWEMPKDPSTTALKEMKQTWFPGVHTNIGGSYDDAGMADITFAWMASNMMKNGLLDFDQDYFLDQQKQNKEFYETDLTKTHEANSKKWFFSSKSPEIQLAKRGWSLGRVYNSAAGVQGFLGGTDPRHPGVYRRTDPDTGKEKNERLKDTHEFFHRSVRTRIAWTGNGTEDEGAYNPKSLEGYKPLPPNADMPVGSKKRPWKEDTNSNHKDFDDRWKWYKTEKDSISKDHAYIIEDEFEQDSIEGHVFNAWANGWSGASPSALQESADKVLDRYGKNGQGDYKPRI